MKRDKEVFVLKNNASSRLLCHLFRVIIKGKKVERTNGVLGFDLLSRCLFTIKCERIYAMKRDNEYEESPQETLDSWFLFPSASSHLCLHACRPLYALSVQEVVQIKIIFYYTHLRFIIEVYPCFVHENCRQTSARMDPSPIIEIDADFIFNGKFLCQRITTKTGTFLDRKKLLLELKCLSKATD